MTLSADRLRHHLGRPMRGFARRIVEGEGHRARVLQDRIGYLLKHPAGRPLHEVRRYYASFVDDASTDDFSGVAAKRRSPGPAPRAATPALPLRGTTLNCPSV
jgi:hypothetical protein